jgi:hypothetical protein
MIGKARERPLHGCLVYSLAMPDTGQVTRLKRATDFLLIFVLFPIVVLMAVAIAIAVSLTGLLVYLGALLAAWLFVAFVFPLATGIMTPDEIVGGIRSRRRYETHFEGEPLPEDRLLGRVWKPGHDAPKLGRRPSPQPSRSFE